MSGYCRASTAQSRSAQLNGPADHYGLAVLVESETLMGAAEVRDRLGVGRTRLRELQRREGFPQPLKKLSGGQIWDGAAVEAWIATHRPPPDEPES